MKSWKSLSLVLAGLVAGLLIALAAPSIPVAEAGASGCWLEARPDAQKFEDGVNKKVGEGFKDVVGYQYAVYEVGGAPTEMYTALLCK